MSLQSRFLNLMVSKGAIKGFVKFSTAGQGGPGFSTGAATTYQMHFEYRRQLQWGKDGLITVNVPMAYLATTTFIDPRSRLVFSGTTFRIEKVRQVFDNSPAAVHHIELTLVGG